MRWAEAKESAGQGIDSCGSGTIGCAAPVRPGVDTVLHRPPSADSRSSSVSPPSEPVHRTDSSTRRPPAARASTRVGLPRNAVERGCHRHQHVRSGADCREFARRQRRIAATVSESAAGNHCGRFGDRPAGRARRGRPQQNHVRVPPAHAARPGAVAGMGAVRVVTDLRRLPPTAHSDSISIRNLSSGASG